MKITVLAGEGMVSNLATLGPTTPRRFIGWQYDANQKAYIKTNQPEEITITKNNKNYYVKLVREGGLIAADEETAKFCGINFQGNNKCLNWFLQESLIIFLFHQLLFK